MANKIQTNPLSLVIIAMALLILAGIDAVVADARSLSDLSVLATIATIISMAIFAVLFFYFFLIPVWTWIKMIWTWLKRWLRGEA